MKLVDAFPDLKEFPLANTSSYFRYDSESDPDVASNAVGDRLMYFYQAHIDTICGLRILSIAF